MLVLLVAMIMVMMVMIVIAGSVAFTYERFVLLDLIGLRHGILLIVHGVRVRLSLFHLLVRVIMRVLIPMLMLVAGTVVMVAAAAP